MPATMAELVLRDVPFTPPEVTLRRGAQLLSPKIGMIKSVTRGVHRAQDPALVSLGGTSGDLSRCSTVGKSPDSGSASTDLAAALAAVVGESVERYAMVHFNRDAMVLASYRDVAADAISPEQARLYAEHQVGSGNRSPRLGFFRDDTPIRWVWAHSLTHQRPKLVPASLVYLDYRPEAGATDEVDIGRNSSGGLAAGATLEEALLSGVLEEIERDAFTLTWWHRRTPRRIVLADDDPLSKMLRRRFHSDHPKVDLRFYDLEVELGISVVLATLNRPSDFGHAICVGAAARLDPRAALTKAAVEVGQTFPFLRYLMANKPDLQPAADYSNINSFEKHCLLYIQRPELVEPAMTFLETAPEVALEDLENRSTGRALGDFERCVRRLGDRGFEVLAVDITTPDVRRAGLFVVRVLVPGLAQLHGNHAMPFLGVERLHKLPEQLDWPSQGWDPASSPNPYPHPFP